MMGISYRYEPVLAWFSLGMPGLGLEPGQQQRLGLGQQRGQGGLDPPKKKGRHGQQQQRQPTGGATTANADAADGPRAAAASRPVAGPGPEPEPGQAAGQAADLPAAANKPHPAARKPTPQGGYLPRVG